MFQYPTSGRIASALARELRRRAPTFQESACFRPDFRVVPRLHPPIENLTNEESLDALQAELDSALPSWLVSFLRTENGMFLKALPAINPFNRAEQVMVAQEWIASSDRIAELSHVYRSSSAVPWVVFAESESDAVGQFLAGYLKGYVVLVPHDGEPRVLATGPGSNSSTRFRSGDVAKIAVWQDEEACHLGACAMSSWWRSRYQRQRRDAGRCANPLPHRDAGKSPRAVGVAFKATTGTGRPARRTPRANAMAGEPRLPGRRTRSVEPLTCRALARTCRRSRRQCCHLTR